MNDIRWDYSSRDISIVSDKDNITQSIINRLNTNTDELDYMYEDYGVDLKQYIGLYASETTLQMIKNAITDTLEKDSRLNIIELELYYSDSQTIHGSLRCGFEDEEVEVELEINEEGVDLDG